MRLCDPKTNRRSVVKNVKCVAVKFQRFDETGDDLCKSIERVIEPTARRGFCIAEAREIGSNHPIGVGKYGYQIAEHVAGGWKPVKEEDHGCIASAGFPIENVCVAYRECLICNCHYPRFLWVRIDQLSCAHHFAASGSSASTYHRDNQSAIFKPLRKTPKMAKPRPLKCCRRCWPVVYSPRPVSNRNHARPSASSIQFSRRLVVATSPCS